MNTTDFLAAAHSWVAAMFPGEQVAFVRVETAKGGVHVVNLDPGPDAVREAVTELLAGNADGLRIGEVHDYLTARGVVVSLCGLRRTLGEMRDRAEVQLLCGEGGPLWRWAGGPTNVSGTDATVAAINALLDGKDAKMTREIQAELKSEDFIKVRNVLQQMCNAGLLASKPCPEGILWEWVGKSRHG